VLWCLCLGLGFSDAQLKFRDFIHRSWVPSLMKLHDDITCNINVFSHKYKPNKLYYIIMYSLDFSQLDITLYCSCYAFSLVYTVHILYSYITSFIWYTAIWCSFCVKKFTLFYQHLWNFAVILGFSSIILGFLETNIGSTVVSLSRDINNWAWQFVYVVGWPEEA